MDTGQFFFFNDEYEEYKHILFQIYGHQTIIQTIYDR